VDIRKVLLNGARSGLAKLGLEVSRIRPGEPTFQPINVFELCAFYLMRRIKHPFVLQIGANDGVRFDPLHQFTTDHGWAGLMVEPHPSVFRDLEDNYRGFQNIKTLNVAIGQSDGELSLYTPNDSIIASNPDLSGLCSLDVDVLIRTMTYYKIQNPAQCVQRFAVKALSVATLLKESHLDSIDVLQIDTEGYDWKILSQFDLDDLGVRLINVEYEHLESVERVACVEHLTKHGFEMARYGLDLVAFRR
jgi:FkbM family methyltransferase